MATKKAKPTPGRPSIKKAGGRGDWTVRFPASVAWVEWLDGLAMHLGIDRLDAIERGVAMLAAADRYRVPRPERIAGAIARGRPVRVRPGIDHPRAGACDRADLEAS